MVVPKIEAIKRTCYTDFQKERANIAQMENKRVKPLVFELDQKIWKTLIRFVLIVKN